MFGKAEIFLYTIFEDTLDLVVPAQAKRSIDVAMASVERIITGVIFGCALTCELLIRRVFKRSCTGPAPSFDRRVQ